MASNNQNQVLFETMAVLLLTLALQLSFGANKGFSVFVPLIYFLVEHRRRNRSWDNIGLKISEFASGVKTNWHYILFVSVIMPLVITVVAKAYWPQFLEHVRNRLPIEPTQLVPVIILLIVGALGEEIIFRGFFQGRLSGFMTNALAILIVSVAFGLMHFAKGPIAIVAADISLVVLDSLIYGVVFARSKSVFVSWVAHFTADLVSLGLLLWL